MSFTANKDARDEILRLMSEDYPAVLQQVATEYGRTVPALASIAKVDRGGWPRGIVRPPSIPNITDTGPMLATSSDIWVHIGVSNADELERDEQLECHMTALLRCLTGDGIECSGADTSPPGTQENEQVQYVGVMVRVRAAQAR
jgi:hypothetical protein